uniref:L-Fucosyltransferase n=1 Tax=Plectus sambesii TaxID=2011161 RepID=A0A914VLJ5_9BILA
MTTTITTTTLNPALFDEAYWLLYDETTPGESASESAPEPAQKATRAKGPVNYHYITASFGAACYPGGLSNKLFEFVSLVGIARSVRRKAFILGNTTCVMAAAKEISSYFPRSSIEYVRNKLKILHRESLVALIGDDVLWAKSRFRNDHWARIPSAMSKRPTIDYAFFAQHCQSIILTASASTFGFWSAYLSSATAIYYNSKFDKDNQLTSQLKPEDFFPPGWIPLHHNISTNSVIEIVR